MKKKVLYIGLFICAMLAINALSSAMRAWLSVLMGQHGKPAFVTPGFQAFNLVCVILFVLAYFLLGKFIPVKNNILRGLVYTLLFWSSDFFPQIMGMIGGTSTILSADAMSVPTIAIDTLEYILTGIALGFFFVPDKICDKRACDKASLVKACALSTIAFPVLLGICEFIAGTFNTGMHCVNSFGITEETHFTFYITFYLFQAVSGLVMPLFYRYTEFNGVGSWVRFASIFGILIWLPIVIVVIFFGVNPVITCVWGTMMLVVIYLDTFLYTRLLKSL